MINLQIYWILMKQFVFNGITRINSLTILVVLHFIIDTLACFQLQNELQSWIIQFHSSGINSIPFTKGGLIKDIFLHTWLDLFLFRCNVFMFVMLILV